MDRKTKLRIWRNRGAFALLIGIAGYGTVTRLREEPQSATSSWPAGAAAHYRLDWQMDSEVAVDGQALPLAGHVDLTGSLSLVSHGERDGSTLIEASLASVGRHRLEVLGQDALADDAAATALVGPVAWVELAADGEVEHVYFDRSAPPVFKHLMQSVVGLARYTPSTATEWTATEPGPSGIAEVHYRRSGASLVRTRDRYSKLMVVPNIETAAPVGSASIELDDAGRIATLIDDETLDIPHRYSGRSHFAITLERHADVALGPVPALAELEARRPAEPMIDGDADRAHLEQRVGKLTFDGLVHGLTASWGDRGAKREWFGQAVALLRLDSALCNEVVEIAFGSGGSDRARLLAMDLLASTGHATAQAAMREALGRSTAQAQRVALIQKFTGVVWPTADSARFLLATSETATGNLGTATAYTMGAVANRLRATDPALSAKLDASVRESLARATTGKDRAELLTALGNSASADNFTVVKGYTTDVDPTVRGRAAWALRGIETPAARDTLFDLIGDADADVARSSLAALANQRLTADDFDRLELATAGKLAEASRAALIDLLANHISDASPAVRRMLEAITATSNDPNLQERARVVLAQLH